MVSDITIMAYSLATLAACAVVHLGLTLHGRWKRR
jgi:hypothetical protein